MTIGLQLLQTNLKDLKHENAAQLRVTLRTLRNWCAIAKSGKQLKRGRPLLRAALHQQALWLVGREMKKQDYTGWRPVAKALSKSVPTTLVQLYVSKFKKRRRKLQRAREEKNRISIEVTTRNALWVQDGMSGGHKIPEPLEAQVIKDRAPLTTVSIVTGPPATGEKIVEMLKSVKPSKGLPFVLGTDNGPCFRAAIVKDFLYQEKIIHLFSRAHTPQHNGSAEIRILELQEAAALNFTVWAQGATVVQDRLEKAAYRLDHGRLRGSKGFKTSAQLDKTMPIVYDNVRAHFFEVCSKHKNHATEGLTNTHDVRMAERNAVFDTLEEFGFIKRTRGGRPYTMKSDPKAEVFF